MSPRSLSSFLLLPLLLLGCSKETTSETPKQGSHECRSPLDDKDVTLDPDEVHELVEEYDELLGNCYNRALDANPTLQGRIEVNLVVDPTGTPTQVCSGASTLPDSRVVSCIVRTFARFRFNERDEVEAGIYPVTFAPN